MRLWLDELNDFSTLNHRKRSLVLWLDQQIINYERNAKQNNNI